MAKVVYEIAVTCPQCGSARVPVQRTGKKYRRRKCRDCGECFLSVRVRQIEVTCGQCRSIQILAEFRVGQTVTH